MPEWPEIIAQHGELVWETIYRVIPTEDASARVVGSFVAARHVAHRDAVSNWSSLLRHIATREAIAQLRQQGAEPGATPGDSVRAALAALPEPRALAFAMRYFSGFSYAAIAMELRAPLDSIGPLVSDTCTAIGRQLLIWRGQEALPGADTTQAADDLLERGVAEINSVAVPPMPQALFEQCNQAVLAEPEQPFEKPPEPSRAVPIMLASIVALIIISVVLVRIYTREPPPAFAIDAVISAIREKPSVGYHLVRTMTLKDQRERKLEADIISREPGLLRQTMAPPDDTIIWDRPAGKALTLDSNRKRATLRDIPDMLEEITPVDALPLLKAIDLKTATPTVQRTISGRTSQGFRIKSGPAAMALWADLESKLPVLVEITFAPPQTPGNALLSGFNWEPPDQTQLFSLIPPTGYELSEFRVNLKPATEIDLLRALDLASRFNGGKFPASFDRRGVAELIKQQQAKLPANRNSAEYQAASDQLDAELLQLSRGFLFIAENGDDWHYAGAGVFISSRDPVVWYRPAGSSNYRVINGSLDVRIIPPDRLPETPAVLMAKPTTRPQIMGN